MHKRIKSNIQNNKKLNTSDDGLPQWNKILSIHSCPTFPITFKITIFITRKNYDFRITKNILKLKHAGSKFYVHIFLNSTTPQYLLLCVKRKFKRNV